MRKFLLLCTMCVAAGLVASSCSDSDDNEIRSYTVTFDSMEGSAVSSQTVNEGAKVTKPTDPTREGYEFDGWYKESTHANEWNFDTDVVSSNTTLYAKWLDVSLTYYTVTFDFLVDGIQPVTSQVADGETVSRPDSPALDGHELSGWYTEATHETEWDFDTDVVTSDITLYALWTREVTVTFNTKSGSPVEEMKVPVGEAVPEPAEPTLDGYDFDGWYTDSEYTTPYEFTGVAEGSITLYAKWKINGATEFYMATDGSDYNPGTIDAPFATLNHARKQLSKGNTLWIRGGTYYHTNADISRTDATWAYVYDFSTAGGAESGSASAPFNIWGYEGERPIFNMSGVRPDPVRRVIVFYVDRSYYHFKNFEVVGTQVVVTGHTQSECFRNDGGNYNTYENLSMHDGMAIGFYLNRGMNNLILNCDAYNNYDNFSDGPYGGNVDGFGAHVPRDTHVGNVFRGCRAWWNSDDGFDLINCFAPVVFENCWSFYNGYQPNSFDNAGDGSGFKSGGYGLNGPVTITDVPRHTVRGCLAYRNRQQGFYANHHLGGINFYNNTGMSNPSNFNMLNRDAPENNWDRPEGYDHNIKNNVSYTPGGKGHIQNVNYAQCDVSHNSFYPVEMTLTDADFMSVNANELTQARKADGSLPDINFLRPKPGSQLIGAGVLIGEDYTGTTLGCFQ